MKEKFTLWQLAALAHPHTGADKPDAACIHARPGERSVILTCDVDDESAESYGGPVWHVSVFPPNRAKAELLLPASAKACCSTRRASTATSIMCASA